MDRAWRIYWQELELAWKVYKEARRDYRPDVEGAGVPPEDTYMQEIARARATRLETIKREG